MRLHAVAGRFAPLATALVLAGVLAGCTSTGMVSQRTQGYEISDSAIQQIRPGQSQELVRLVLGSPQTTNNFGGQEAWYYVETRVTQTAFGLTTVRERKVLAVYFDGNSRVSQTALYGLEDGRVVDFDTRRTPSFGQDRSFIESIIASI